MPALPTMLKISQKRCVIIGGGKVALRRAKTLLEAGADITVVAPQINQEIATLKVNCKTRPYKHGDLKSAFLAVIATDKKEVNDKASQEAKTIGALINRADEPEKGDITIPAHAHNPPITIAVDTARSSPRAAAQIRDELAESLDPDWQKFLQTISPYREIIKHKFLEPKLRKAKLKKLATCTSLQEFKKHGKKYLTDKFEDILK